MNTPPAFDTASSCSSSVGTPSMPRTPDFFPESNHPSSVPSLLPALSPADACGDVENGHLEQQFHAKFQIGPEIADGHECTTVPEEDEDDDETASELHEPITPASDSVRSAEIFVDSSSDGLGPHHHHPPPLVMSTPATPPAKDGTPKLIEEPSPAGLGIGRGHLRRQASEKLHGFIRRVQSSSDKTGPGLGLLKDEKSDKRPKSPQAKAKAFFSQFTTPTQSANPSPQDNTSPTSTVASNSTVEPPASSGNMRPMSFVERSPSSPPRRPNVFSRKQRSNSVSGIRNIQDATAITHPAVAGAGTKSRRLSYSSPGLKVAVKPLSQYYSHHSHVPGKSKVCGTGVSAIVKLMHKNDDDRKKVYAVKEFRKRGKDEDKEDYLEKIGSEFYISKSLHHPNIVQTEDLCMSTSGRYCHIMEYCAGGDLFGICRKGFMKDKEKDCIFKQLLKGVSYLHDHGIAHRDLKPENLLVTADGHLKITDFGVSEVFSGKHPGVAGFECGVGMTENRLSKPGIVGSAPYIAPEVQQRTGAYDARKLDVWSCGIIFFVLTFNGPLWNKADPSDPNFARYLQCFNKWQEKCPDGPMSRDGPFPVHALFSRIKYPAMRLVYRMLHLDPAFRLTIKECLNDPWINGIECCNANDIYMEEQEEIDASHKNACHQAGKAAVFRLHQHLPVQTANPLGRDYTKRH